MNIYFDSKFIKNDELLFFIYLIVILIMILITVYIGYKENKK